MLSRSVIHGLTGLFVLSALFLAGLALVARPTLQGWFGTVRRCEAWLPAAYVKRGDPVEFRAYRVGRVVAVEPEPWSVGRGENWFRVAFDVENDWCEAVTDAFSVSVSIGAFGALTGTSLVLLAPNERVTLDRENPAELRGRPLASIEGDGAVELRFVKPGSILEELADQARDLLDRIGPKAEQIVAVARGIVDELAREDGDLFTFVRTMRVKAEGLQEPLDDAIAILADVRVLVHELNDPEGQVQRLLRHATGIAEALEGGEGVVGGLLREGEIKDETIALFRRTNAVLEETRELLARSQATMADVNEGSREFPVLVAGLVETVAKIEAASRVLPGLAEEVRRALEQANLVLVGLRESAVLGVFADFSPPAPGAAIVLPAARGAAPPSAPPGAGGGR